MNKATEQKNEQMAGANIFIFRISAPFNTHQGIDIASKRAK